MSGSDPEALETQRSRLNALRAAWGVLAPAGLSASSQGQEISQTGRAMTDRLGNLQDSAEILSQGDLDDLDQQLCQFEVSMRAVAVQIPVSEFRSTLPNELVENRSSLLELLDVLIGNDPHEFAVAPDRIGTIDYLITLLCTGSDSPDATIRHDPANLTLRLQELCIQAEEACGSQFSDVEAEFFAAAALGENDIREEFQLRTLRSRKSELGMAFFVPRILRSIVTYNAALLAQVRNEIFSSGDWGFLSSTENAATLSPERFSSAFASEPLRRIAEAVGRRAHGQDAKPDAADQIAWALDFDYLDRNERKSLTSKELATEEDPLGTAILVGLICRSLAVLSIELQTIGIFPDDVSDQWIPELNEVFQRQINENIASDAYKIACSLSELKNKFLSDPLADQFRQQRVATSATRSTFTKPTPHEETGKAQGKEENPSSARNLVMEALEGYRDDQTESVRAKPLPWARIAQLAALSLLVIASAVLFLRSSAGLERWTREDLERVSPYLASGKRSQDGVGPAFIGRIDDAWLALPIDERSVEAESLVFRLRDLGMTQIMIYDNDDAIRIQAVGLQSILAI